MTDLKTYQLQCYVRDIHQSKTSSVNPNRLFNVFLFSQKDIKFTQGALPSQLGTVCRGRQEQHCPAVHEGLVSSVLTYRRPSGHSFYWLQTQKNQSVGYQTDFWLADAGWYLAGYGKLQFSCKRILKALQVTYWLLQWGVYTESVAQIRTKKTPFHCTCPS